MYQKTTWVTALLMAALGRANISNDAWWQSHNWSNSNLEIEVVDGEVRGTSETTRQFLESPRTIIGHPDDYAS